MPVSELHRQVASIALHSASGHGFALGGGNALLAHGIITRPTSASAARRIRTAPPGSRIDASLALLAPAVERRPARSQLGGDIVACQALRVADMEERRPRD